MLVKKGNSTTPKKIGSFTLRSWVAGDWGFYYELNNRFIFVRDSGKEEPIPGVHPHTSWAFGPQGIFLERDHEFFLLSKDGKEYPLCEFVCDSWTPGPRGLYFEYEGNVYILPLSIEGAEDP